MTSTPGPTRPSRKVLVAYASRHGSTAEIAERIAQRLSAAGHAAVAMDVDEVADVAAYDAYIIGGAAYMFRWLRSTVRFVRRNEELLAQRPLWLFASGPLGDQEIDDEGNDLLEASRPKEFDELHESLDPRAEKVFYGKWDSDAPPIGLAERMMRFVPAGRDALPAGDFRDWPAIDAWADEIATALPDLELPTTDGSVHE
ncbi:MAG: flavodoxin domain-containing protein [Nitriliruptoraceae bacterium]